MEKKKTVIRLVITFHTQLGQIIISTGKCHKGLVSMSPVSLAVKVHLLRFSGVSHREGEKYGMYAREENLQKLCQECSKDIASSFFVQRKKILAFTCF